MKSISYHLVLIKGSYKSLPFIVQNVQLLIHQLKTMVNFSSLLILFLTLSDFHNPFHPWLLSPFSFILCIILAFNRHTSFLRHFLTYSGLFHSWLTWLFAKVCYISDTLLAMASLPSLVESFLARYFLWFILALSLGKFWSLLKIADFSYNG